jgi:ribosomal protein L37AE/L43A
MALARASTAYRGPACPRCRTPLELGQISDGAVTCRSCGRGYEARIFRPVTRAASVPQLAHAGPEEAGACANHPRNAAVTNCGRCGIFICALCQLEVDGSTYCPACFERLAQEGSLESAKTSFRDYGSMAVFSALIGAFFSFLILGIPLGLLALYYAYRGFRTRKESGAGLTSLILGAFLAVIDILLSSFILFALFQPTHS